MADAPLGSCGPWPVVEIRPFAAFPCFVRIMRSLKKSYAKTARRQLNSPGRQAGTKNNILTAEFIGSLHPLTIPMNSKNASPSRREMTQDVGLATDLRPTMLWIGRDGQYKSLKIFVKTSRAASRAGCALGWT